MSLLLGSGSMSVTDHMRGVCQAVGWPSNHRQELFTGGNVWRSLTIPSAMSTRLSLSLAAPAVGCEHPLYILT